MPDVFCPALEMEASLTKRSPADAFILRHPPGVIPFVENVLTKCHELNPNVL